MADSAFRERSQGLLTITVPVMEAPRSSELHTQRRLLGAFLFLGGFAPGLPPRGAPLRYGRSGMDVLLEGLDAQRRWPGGRLVRRPVGAGRAPP